MDTARPLCPAERPKPPPFSAKSLLEFRRGSFWQGPARVYSRPAFADRRGVLWAGCLECGCCFFRANNGLNAPPQRRIRRRRADLSRPGCGFLGFAVPGAGRGRDPAPALQARVRGSWRPLVSFPRARGVGIIRCVRSRRARGLKNVRSDARRSFPSSPNPTLDFWKSRWPLEYMVANCAGGADRSRGIRRPPLWRLFLFWA